MSFCVIVFLIFLSMKCSRSCQAKEAVRTLPQTEEFLRLNPGFKKWMRLLENFPLKVFSCCRQDSVPRPSRCDASGRWDPGQTESKGNIYVFAPRKSQRKLSTRISTVGKNNGDVSAGGSHPQFLQIKGFPVGQESAADSRNPVVQFSLLISVVLYLF